LVDLKNIGELIYSIDREKWGEIFGYLTGLGSQAGIVALASRNGWAVVSLIKNSAWYVKIIKIVRDSIKYVKLSKLALEGKYLDSLERIWLKYVELKWSVKLTLAEYRIMLETIRRQLLQRFGWQEALIDDLPINYLQKLTEEIKDGISADKERFLAMVGERRIKTVEEYSKLKRETVFAKMPRNKILEDLDEINSAEDLLEIARKYEYTDPLIDKWAIFVKWDKDGAMEIIVRLEEKGWIEKKWHTNIVNWKK